MLSEWRHWRLALQVRKLVGFERSFFVTYIHTKPRNWNCRGRNCTRLRIISLGIGALNVNTLVMSNAKPISFLLFLSSWKIITEAVEVLVKLTVDSQFLVDVVELIAPTASWTLMHGRSMLWNDWHCWSLYTNLGLQDTVKAWQNKKLLLCYAHRLPLANPMRGAVAQRVERWTCDQQFVGSIPTRGKAA